MFILIYESNLSCDIQDSWLDLDLDESWRRGLSPFLFYQYCNVIIDLILFLPSVKLREWTADCLSAPSLHVTALASNLLPGLIHHHHFEHVCTGFLSSWDIKCSTLTWLRLFFGLGTQLRLSLVTLLPYGLCALWGSCTLATAVWQIFQMISLSPQTIQAQPLSFTFTEIWSSAGGTNTHTETLSAE